MARCDWYRDTAPEALEVLLRLQREMTVSQKVNAVLDLSAMVMCLQEIGERSLHPEASEREIFLRAAARRLGRETMIRAYRWDPEIVDLREPGGAA